MAAGVSDSLWTLEETGGADQQMSALYLIREISTSGTRVVDATPYKSREAALRVIIGHLARGGIIKAWIEDQDGDMVMLPELVSAAFEDGRNSN
jgi:hypothetical protein